MRFQEGGIAFFDSGIGGLTTLSVCVDYFRTRLSAKELPTFYYYGDNFRAPYGNLPREKIFEYVSETFSLFEKLKVSLAVIACNTATAVCIEDLRKKYSFEIIGTEPALLTAAKNGGEVFALVTRATYESERFSVLRETVEKKYPNSRIKAFACDELAGAIEKNYGNPDFDFTRFFPQGTPSSVVLGCTHYSYVKREIESFYGCLSYDSNAGVAKRLYSSFCKIEEEKKRKIGNSSEKTGESERRCEENTLKDISCEFDFFPFFKGKNSDLKSGIYFLGDGCVVNKPKYERLFVVTSGQK